MQATFRCPFEMKGEADGTIRRVLLGTDRNERLVLMRDAFQEFSSDLNRPAIRFCLSPALWQECTTLRALKKRILSFQVEVLGAELEFRLTPFLPPQIAMVGREECERVKELDPIRLSVASALSETINLSGSYPQSAADIADWIETEMRSARDKGTKDPDLTVFGPTLIRGKGPSVALLQINASSASVLSDRIYEPENPHRNRNTFSIVKAPFYPKPFGRYSDGVEIVVSREADFAALSQDIRLRIRRQSNLVLRSKGVKIKDLDEDKQPLGVWIPKMR
jgi:hypothetical protein